MSAERSDSRLLVARNLGPGELDGGNDGSLTVPPGMRCVVHGPEGRTSLPPGRHRLDDLRRRLGARSQDDLDAYLVCDAPLRVRISAVDVTLDDGRGVDVAATARLRVTAPDTFRTDLLGTRPELSLAALAERLGPELEPRLRRAVADLGAQACDPEAEQATLEASLLRHWQEALDGTGLSLSRVEELGIRHPEKEARDRRRRRRRIREGEREERADAARVELEHASDRMSLETESLTRAAAETDRRDRVRIDAELDAMERERERLERRQKILDDLLSADTLERMTRLRSEEEWRRFRDEIDRERLLRQQEWERLRTQASAEAGQRRERQEHLRRRLTATAEHELEVMQLRHQARLRLQELRGRKEIEAEQAGIERDRLEREIEARRRVFEQELEEQERWFEHRRQQEQTLADLQLDRTRRLEQIRRGGAPRTPSSEPTPIRAITGPEADDENGETAELEDVVADARADTAPTNVDEAASDTGAEPSSPAETVSSSVPSPPSLSYCDEHDLRHPSDGCPLCREPRT